MPPASPTAFARVVRAHQDRVFSLAVHLCGDADDAADLAQEAFVRLYERASDFWPSASDGLLRAWLLSTVRRLVIDRHRTRHALRDEAALDAALDDAPSPYEAAETGDAHARAFAALDTLREPYRSLVLLRDVEDLPYAEIGKVLDLPPASVKVYLHRARAMLRAAYLRRTREFA
ncbi:MAG TPA: sigma-70 family RNA polymerase sigma factor [Rhodothermales bacterium]|nr:sigma-70 family RNA polymerase sigma factor [Rhodothermales bacterium]